MASITKALDNIAGGVTNYFTGRSNDATYPWVKYLGAFLSEQTSIINGQHRWRLNLGYSFTVRNGPPPGNSYTDAATSWLTTEEEKNDMPGGNFNEFRFNINPQNITMKEPFAIDILPTQTGYAIQHSGCVTREITINGTTGVHPERGSGGVVKGNASAALGAIGVNNAPAMFSSGTGIFTGGRPGYVHFHLLKNYIKAYVQLKAMPDYKNMQLIWNNKKDNESWIVEPMDFTMVRTDAQPISYQYYISLRALKKTDYIGDDAANQLGVFGDFLDGLRTIETVIVGATEAITIGAGIINQGTEYLRQIYEGVESLIIEPINQVANLLGAVANGVNTVSAMPRQFYTNLQISIKNVEDRLNDIAGEGSASYNTRYRRLDSGSDRTDTGFNYTERDLLRALTNVRRGINMVTSTDLLFSGTTTEPVITSIDIFNTDNSIALSNEDKLALRKTTNAGIEKMFNDRMTIATPPSVKTTIIRRDETLEDIARRTLSDIGRWTDLVILNQLKAPYIETPASASRGTLAPGDRVLIPSNNLPKTNLTSKARRSYITIDMTETEKNLGVDIELNRDNDLRVSNTGDLDLIAGASNAAQAINIILFLERGALKYHPYKGIGLYPGVTSWVGVEKALEDVRTAITSDGRFEQVKNLSITRNGSAIYATMSVSVTDYDESIPLQFAL